MVRVTYETFKIIKMKVTFIIVEYYSIEDVLSCYSDIQNNIHEKIDCEIIISSNSVYPEKQQKEIILRYNYLKWIFNEKNGGFAYAMNRGMAIATGDVFVVMNPDVRIKSGIEEMLNYLYHDNKIGIIAPKIINSKGEVQDSFRDFITPVNFIKRHLKRISKRNNQTDIVEFPAKVDWVIGAFMMMPRQTYEIVKGFDEHYFLYCEDMDICRRISLQGYSVIYYSQAVIEYEGTRSARQSWRYAWIFMNSLFHYWNKFSI